MNNNKNLYEISCVKTVVHKPTGKIEVEFKKDIVLSSNPETALEFIRNFYKNLYENANSPEYRWEFEQFTISPFTPIELD